MDEATFIDFLDLHNLTLSEFLDSIEAWQILDPAIKFKMLKQELVKENERGSEQS